MAIDPVAVNTPSANPLTRLRIAMAAAIVLLLAAYTGAVLEGKIPADRKIDTSHLALLALGAVSVLIVCYPRMFSRVQSFEVAGVKASFESLLAAQARQQTELDLIRFVLPLLLPEMERKHLLNLSSSATKGYKGNTAVRGELRRLRSMGLIRMQPEKSIHDIKDNLEVDLSLFVGLTPLGQRWVERIEEFERTQARES